MLVANLSQLTNVWILIVLLVLVSLEHDASFDGFVASVTLVRCVQIFVVGSTWQVVDRVGQDSILLVLSLFSFLSNTKNSSTLKITMFTLT